MRPGPTGDDAMGPHSNDSNLWHFPQGIELSDNDKRKAVAEVVAIGVRTMAKTSRYKKRDLEAAGGAESDEEPFDRHLITPPRRTAQESRAMSPWDSKGRNEDADGRQPHLGCIRFSKSYFQYSAIQRKNPETGYFVFWP